MKNKSIAVMALAGFLLLLVACSSPEEKRTKYFDKGKALYESGEYVRAGLELKTALQFDPKFADGYYYLAMSELKQQLYREAYGHLTKALEIDPANTDARLELCRFFIGVQQPDSALEQVEQVLAKTPEDPDALLVKAMALMMKRDLAGASGILTRLHQKGDSQPQLFLMMAAIEEEKENSAAAETLLHEGMEKHPENEALLKALSDLFIRHKRYEDAVAPSRDLAALDPDNLPHTLRLAALYWKLENRSEADRLISRFVDKKPETASIWTGIAAFYLSVDEFSKAEETILAGIAANPEGFELRFALAEIYANRGDIPAATSALNQCLALSDDPKNPDILKTMTALAKVSLMSGEVEQARTYINEVLAKDPASVDGHYLLGRIHLIGRDGKNAVSELRTVVNDKPDYLPGHLRLAEAYALDNNLELAVDTLKTALKISPQSEDLQQALLRAYLMKKDFKSAQTQLEETLAKNPKDTKTRSQLGDLMLVTQAVESAEKRYQEVIEENPEDPDAYLKLARAYAVQKNADKAKETLLVGHQANPGSNTLLQVLVKTFLSQNDSPAAIELCMERLRKQPDDAFAYNLLGQVQAATKEYEAAETSFRKAIDIHPDQPEAHNNLALLYLQQGRQNEAISRYEQIIQARPDHPAAYLSLGTIYEQTNQYDRAREIYETASEKLPSHWGIINNLAFLMSENPGENDDMKKALSLALRAQNLNPGSSEVRDTLGWIYFKMGDLQRAGDHLESALSKAPESPIYNYHMAEILYSQGNPEEARQKLLAALDTQQRYPGKTRARELMEKIKQ